MVAYSGYTSSAKQKVVQQNIKSIYKLWSGENARCLAMNNDEPVLKSYTDGTSIAPARCENMNRGHDGSVARIQNIFLQGVNFKNPFGTHSNHGSTNCSDRVDPNGDGNLGHNFICYDSSTMTLRIAACFKTSWATSSNRAKKFIRFDTW